MEISRKDYNAAVATSATCLRMLLFFYYEEHDVSSQYLYNMTVAYRFGIHKDLLLKTKNSRSIKKRFCANGVLKELGLFGAGEIFHIYADPGGGELKYVLRLFTVKLS